MVQEINTNRLWLVIPAYNEEKRISPVIAASKKYISNILVVDDGSSDNTTEVAKKEKVIVLTHIENMGKGAALKTGCDWALINGAEYIIVMDADGQHRPEDIPRFLKELQTHDVVLGYRQLNEQMPFVFRLGNNFLNTITKILFRIKVRDTQSGFRGFTADTYKKIRWESTDYSMESEMIARIGRHKINYFEIPIKTLYGDKYKGTTILDGIRITINMIWWRLAQ